MNSDKIEFIFPRIFSGKSLNGKARNKFLRESEKIFLKFKSQKKVQKQIRVKFIYNRFIKNQMKFSKESSLLNNNFSTNNSFSNNDKEFCENSESNIYYINNNLSNKNLHNSSNLQNEKLFQERNSSQDKMNNFSIKNRPKYQLNNLYDEKKIINYYENFKKKFIDLEKKFKNSEKHTIKIYKINESFVQSTQRYQTIKGYNSNKNPNNNNLNNCSIILPNINNNGNIIYNNKINKIYHRICNLKNNINSLNDQTNNSRIESLLNKGSSKQYFSYRNLSNVYESFN